MSSSFASGFPDTVVLAEGVAPASADGKVAPRGGKELPPQRRAAAPADPEATARALERLAASLTRELRFEVDVEHGETVIYVLDRATGEVIRRIPHEELPRLATPDGGFELKLLDDRL